MIKFKGKNWIKGTDFGEKSWPRPKIGAMVGLTFSSVKQVGDELIFACALGNFVFYHEQNCCECVTIEDVIGDLQDLEGSPILLADESSNRTKKPPKGTSADSHTWTFYKFATIKGYVDIRWFGSSNGYYSERVNLRFDPGRELRKKWYDESQLIERQK